MDNDDNTLVQIGKLIMDIINGRSVGDELSKLRKICIEKITSIEAELFKCDISDIDEGGLTGLSYGNLEPDDCRKFKNLCESNGIVLQANTQPT